MLVVLILAGLLPTHGMYKKSDTEFPNNLFRVLH